MFRRLSIRHCSTPTAAYNRLVLNGTISLDERQVAALPTFDRLYTDLAGYITKYGGNPPPRHVELRPPNRLGVVPSFFLRREQQEKVQRALREATSTGNSSNSSNSGNSAAYHPLSHVRGLYVYGGVGCGKTMMMDLLFHNAPLKLKKRRVHFHQFMLDVQRTSHDIQYKTQGKNRDGLHKQSEPQLRRTADASVDLFDEVAQRLISDVELLCFDEVAVADVAHAMILRRLFHAFYKMGLVVVFTSNRKPDDLYMGGLNRESFLPFIDLVKRQCVIYDMQSGTDHRLSGSNAQTYFAPINSENDGKFNNVFLQMCKGMAPSERVLRVFGRDVIVPTACGGVCRFHFSQICDEALCTADYEVIAKTFHTVFIEGVPRFSYENSDAKQRLLLLVDALYEFRCKVVVYAQVEPMQLQETKEEHEAQLGITGGTEDHALARSRLTEFERETGKRLMDEGDASFQMERCISRLCEMRTKGYLESTHRYEGVTLCTE